VLTSDILDTSLKDLQVGLHHVPHLHLAEHFINQSTFVSFSEDFINLTFMKEVFFRVFE